jgi:hypothetical protein
MDSDCRCYGDSRWSATQGFGSQSAASFHMPEKKNSLVANINRRKAQGKSRPEKESTITPEAYKEMREGWPSRKRTPKAKK